MAYNSNRELKEEKFKRGLIVGKFYPFHKGHQYLVETGLKRVKELTVVVCELSEHKITGKQRAAWIRQLYPQARVLVRNYDGVDPHDSKLWAKLAVEWMGGKPDVVLTSEDYGQRWAACIGCEHILVDKERMRWPISGTKIREDQGTTEEFLHPVVRAFLETSKVFEKVRR